MIGVERVFSIMGHFPRSNYELTKHKTKQNKIKHLISET